MRARARVGIAVAGVLLGAQTVAHAQERHAPENKGVFERDAVDVDAPEGVDIGLVRVDNRLGDVSVRGHDGTGIAIQSFKRAADKETLERLVVSLIPDAKGHVRIRTTLRAGPESRPVAAGSIAVDLIVMVPHSAMVDAELWKGNLRVSGLDNGATLLVDRGLIEVKQVSGEIRSDLRRGDQNFAEVFGELEARGIDGALRFDEIRGERLSANMVRGTIHGEGLKVEHLSVQSVFGDIELVVEPVEGGHYRVASRKGNVQFRFHGGTPVEMNVVAARAMLGPELNALQSEGALSKTSWRGRFGSMSKPGSKVRPAQLEVRSETGQVLVKHF